MNSIKFTQEFEKSETMLKDAFGGLTSLAAAATIVRKTYVSTIHLQHLLPAKLKRKWQNVKQDKTVQLFQLKLKINQTLQCKGAAKEPIKAEAPAKVAPQFDTGSTNLLEKFKNNILHLHERGAKPLGFAPSSSITIRLQAAEYIVLCAGNH